MIRLALLAAVLVYAAGTAAVSSTSNEMSRRAGSGGDSQSTNWAGYTVTAVGVSFVDVKGSWVEPTLDCSTSGPGSSAFWVGLGGFSDGSKALEQVGTSADCMSGGAAIHSAWHELVPAPAIDDDIRISPGDVISAEVSADGPAITLQLHDLTTGESAVTQSTMAEPDLTSAEWIAEAPSMCSPFNPNGCTVKPLANFGTVAFATGSATAGGHTGAITDPEWTAGAIQLVTRSGKPVAQPSDLGADGSSFTVTWVSTGATFKLLLQDFVTTPQTPRAGLDLHRRDPRCRDGSHRARRREDDVLGEDRREGHSRPRTDVRVPPGDLCLADPGERLGTGHLRCGDRGSRRRDDRQDVLASDSLALSAGQISRR